MCGNTNPRKMIALMMNFFGEYLDLPRAPGYVYICPDCYDELIVPHLHEVRKLLHSVARLTSKRGKDEAEDGPAVTDSPRAE